MQKHCILDQDALHTDQQLSEKIAAGDRDAFTELFSRYHPVIYTAAENILRSKDLAEEVVQDTFLKIWLKRATLTSVNNLKAYLLVTARNYALEALRRMAYEREAAKELGAADAVFADPLMFERDQQKMHEWIGEAVSALPTRQREVFELIKQKGLKREEAARTLGLDSETVKHHLAKAMRSVRAYCLAKMEVPACILTVGATVVM